MADVTAMESVLADYGEGARVSDRRADNPWPLPGDTQNRRREQQ